jgi:hypothetical protein
MAAMTRRRVDALGRHALQAAYWGQPARPEMASSTTSDSAPDGNMPVIFASRHGDTGRSYQLLRDLAAGEPLSPTSFSLSVHNAIGALYSIDRRDTANYQAIAAGPATVEMALVEAAGLLADGASEVLVVHYEAPLAEAYTVFADEPEATYAWAWRVGAPIEGAPRYEVSSHSTRVADMPVEPVTLPHGLAVLHFLLAEAPVMIRDTGTTRWIWSRHG